jgi:hypothetical protein
LAEFEEGLTQPSTHRGSTRLGERRSHRSQVSLRLR